MAEPFLGEIRLFAFNVIPRDWAPCQGQLLQIRQYQALYALLGVVYGGDGVTTFGLPDLRGRVPLHISPDYRLGAAGGESAHALTVNEMPSHTHQVAASNALASSIPPAGNIWPQSVNTYSADGPNVQMGPNAISVAGGSQPHNNMQPYMTLSFCIALSGSFPSRP